MKKRGAIFILVALTIAFTFGLLQLFNTRLAGGDIYPEYSSLRTDPLGTMAFYESLERIPGISVSRDFNADESLPETVKTTYLHLAARKEDWEWMPERTIKEIEGFLSRGGRLVVVFFPQTSKSLFTTFRARENEAAGKKEKASDKARKKKKQISGDLNKEQFVNAKERWGLEFGFVPLPKSSKNSFDPVPIDNQSELPLPKTMEWHSGGIFTNLSPAWEVVFARENSPVVIERRFGSGYLVMATDSFFLSNEALSKDRHSDLLAWVIGPSSSVVFDESHFGIMETTGVAVLIRKYHLTAFMAALFCLAALFIWKNASRFGPTDEAEPTSEPVAGKEAAAGFVNLLRRNVPPEDMLNVCLAEWEKSHATDKRLEAKLEHARTIVADYHASSARDRNPVKTYIELSALLAKSS